MTEWISVEDILPEGGSGSYITYRPNAPTGSKVCTLWYDPLHNGWSGNYKVYYWMPLPEPPAK